MNPSIFECIQLDRNHKIYISYPIKAFTFDFNQFKELWQLHPETYHTIKIHGKEIPTPRWQQAYGKNYNYTGAKNNALPIPSQLQFFLDWAKSTIDERLNGLLLNWYDGQKGHYIGAHRDDTRDLAKNSPIVTISIGQERLFRMRKHGQKGYKDLTIRNSSVIIIPWDTNLKWTHEVPNFKKHTGRRISITLRAFL